MRPMSYKPSLKAGYAGAEIRRLAVPMVMVLWCLGIVLGLWNGRTFPQPISNAAASALGGLTAWLTYHIVSR